MNSKKVINLSAEDKLKLLFNLQKIDSQIDSIRKLRGELPLEVQDLEDEVAGLETRIEHLNDEIAEIAKKVNSKKITIEESKSRIKKYETQQMNVRNNREFDALTKEIEFQNLEIQLAEKRINEGQLSIEEKEEVLESSNNDLSDRQKELKVKSEELDEIISDTEKEEKKFLNQSNKFKAKIEDRLVRAYTRIRDNALNGLAVVTVQRNACGGCFNRIPPQRQLDIKLSKKIIVCEYCGRVLVDKVKIAGEEEEKIVEKPKRRITRRKRQV